MHRFFIKPEQVNNDEVVFLPEEINQLKNVLRLKAGERVIVLDNRGSVFTVEISKPEGKTIKGKIVEKEVREKTSKFFLSLGQSLTKGPKADFIIQKATELGADNISFIETERSVVKYKSILESNRLARWQKIAKEAAEQSQRLFIPTLSCCQDLEEFCVASKEAELKLIFWEEEKEKRLRDCFKNDIDISRLSILVGPEGGFSKKEIDMVKHFGFVSTGLGPRILRAETAIVSILSVIQYIKGELG